MPTGRAAAARWYLGGEQPSRRTLVRAGLIDGVLVLIVAVLAAFGSTMTLEGDHHPLLVVGALLVVPTVLVRRSFPHVGMVLGAATPISIVFAYLAGVRMRSWRRGFGALLLATLVAAPVTAMTPPDKELRDSWLDVLVSLVLLAIPYLIGAYRGQRRRLLDALRARNQHLERERILLVREARLRERSRIARDMHDSLGHHLSLISLRIGGLQVSPRLSDEDRGAAREIRGTVHAAMEELRDILDILKDRDDVQDRGQPLTRARVEEMATAARGAGQDVRLQHDNELKPLPPRTEQAAYRLLQEGLTNARRHAPGAEVTLVLGYGEDALHVAVVNTAPQGNQTMPRSTGQGLAGLAERIRFAGGTLEAAKSPDGGFRLAAVLPYDQSDGAVAGGFGLLDSTGPGGHDHPDDLDLLANLDEPNWSAGSSGTGTWVEPGIQARRMIGVAVVTLVVLALGGLVAGGLWLQGEVEKTLVAADTFQAIKVGESKSQVLGKLPENGEEPKLAEQAPATPNGTTCHYYFAEGGETPEGIPDPTQAYQFCFKGTELVAKKQFPIRKGSFTGTVP